MVLKDYNQGKGIANLILGNNQDYCAKIYRQNQLWEEELLCKYLIAKK